MITEVHLIKNFGVFKDFNWNRNTSLQDFQLKNIIYGWNYSGKTTLSRVFSSLRDKSIHPDYSEAYFKLSLENGDELESTDLLNSELKFFFSIKNMLTIIFFGIQIQNSGSLSHSKALKT